MRPVTFSDIIAQAELAQTRAYCATLVICLSILTAGGLTAYGLTLHFNSPAPAACGTMEGGL